MSNSKTTPDWIVQENQEQWVENKETRFKKWLNKIWTTVIAWLTTLQIGILWTSNAMAWGLPEDMSIQNPDAKELVVDNKAEQPELLKKIIDTKVEKEMLELYATKKWWDKLIERYNSLQDSYKSRVLDYYKNLDWKPLKAFSGLIQIFNNAQIWLKYITDYKETQEVWNMPETIESWLIFMLDFDPNWKALFSKNELEFFKVIDNTSIWINEAYIAKTEEYIAKKEENIAKIQEQINFLNELNKKLSAIN